LDAYRRIVPVLPGLLAPGGWAALEIGLGQADAVRRLLEAAGFARIESAADLSGIDRCLLAQALSG
jgi:release factor glutamine methyltransferase